MRSGVAADQQGTHVLLEVARDGQLPAVERARPRVRSFRPRCVRSSVTKLRPGQVTTTRASVIFNGAPPGRRIARRCRPLSHYGTNSGGAPKPGFPWSAAWSPRSRRLTRLARPPGSPARPESRAPGLASSRRDARAPRRSAATLSRNASSSMASRLMITFRPQPHEAISRARAPTSRSERDAILPWAARPHRASQQVSTIRIA